MAEEIVQITELDALTAPNEADIIAVVDDVAGSPVTKKATLSNVLATPVNHRDFDEQSSNPDTPASGDVRMFARADGQIYKKDDAGVVSVIGGGDTMHDVQGRLTLTSGDPWVVEKASATVAYFTPHNGDKTRMYDSSLSVWKTLSFSELSFKATDDSQTGDTTSGNAVISDLTDTSLLVIGMEVTGTGIGNDAFIDSIDSATQVTLDTNSTADGNDIAITFKLPADSATDMFLELQSGAVAFRRPVLWTDLTTRATALTTLDAVDVLTGDTDSIFIGTIITGDTEGEIDAIYNHYGNDTSLMRCDTTVNLVGGYMSDATKSASSWSTSSITNGSNCYDNNDSTYGSIAAGATGTIEVDFGSAFVLSQVDLLFDAASNRMCETASIWGSATGLFAGEETLIVNAESNPQTAALWSIDFDAAEYRYWKVSATDSGGGLAAYLYQIDFYYGVSMAVAGVPFGCEAEIWNGAASAEAVTSENYLNRTQVAEFSVSVASVDKITITRPNGDTPWLEFGINPAATGAIYSLTSDR